MKYLLLAIIAVTALFAGYAVYLAYVANPRVERELLSLSEEAVAQAFGDVILDPMLEEARQELQRLVEAEAADLPGGEFLPGAPALGPAGKPLTLK